MAEAREFTTIGDGANAAIEDCVVVSALLVGGDEVPRQRELFACWDPSKVLDVTAVVDRWPTVVVRVGEQPWARADWLNFDHW